MKGVAPLIHEVSFGALLADKAFDADWLLQDLDTRGAAAVIPPKANRNVQRDYDAHMYKWRHLIENYFAKIKEFRGIATRYDKTDTSYAANWYLTATLIARRGLSTGPSRTPSGADSTGLPVTTKSALIRSSSSRSISSAKVIVGSSP